MKCINCPANPSVIYDPRERSQFCESHVLFWVRKVDENMVATGLVTGKRPKNYLQPWCRDKVVSNIERGLNKPA